MNETTDVIGVVNCFAKMSVGDVVNRFLLCRVDFLQKNVSRDLIFRGQFLLHTQQLQVFWSYQSTYKTGHLSKYIVIINL